MIEKKIKQTNLHFGINSVIRTEDNVPTNAFIRFCFIHYASSEKLNIISLRIYLLIRLLVFIASVMWSQVIFWYKYHCRRKISYLFISIFVYSLSICPHNISNNVPGNAKSGRNFKKSIIRRLMKIERCL